MNSFSSRLKKLVAVAPSMSAAERLLGVSPTALRAWLGGDTPLDSKLRGIALRTGLAFDWLRDGKGDDDDQVALFRAFMINAPTPRIRMQRAIEMSGLTPAQIAREIGYDTGVVERAITSGRASERMITAICRVVPNLDKHELMAGSDDPPVLSHDGSSGTYGSTPTVVLPAGVNGFMVPLLSFAQAGKYDRESVDEGWNGDSVLAVGLNDRRAFGLVVAGLSMHPVLSPGDIAIVVPSLEPRKSDIVAVRTTKDEVLCKYWDGTKKGNVNLRSANPDFPPMQLPQDTVRWMYTIPTAHKKLRS